MNKKYPKIVLSLLFVLLILSLVWLASWKTYYFPNDQGLIKYPPTWNVTYNGSSSGFIRSEEGIAEVYINQDFRLNDLPLQEDVKLRSQKWGISTTKEIKIAHEQGYLTDNPETKGSLLAGQYIDTSYNGYIYTFQFYYAETSIGRMWEKFIDFLMIHSIYFNPNAKPTNSVRYMLKNALY